MRWDWFLEQRVLYNRFKDSLRVPAQPQLIRDSSSKGASSFSTTGLARSQKLQWAAKAQSKFLTPADHLCPICGWNTHHYVLRYLSSSTWFPSASWAKTGEQQYNTWDGQQIPTRLVRMHLEVLSVPVSADHDWSTFMSTGIGNDVLFKKMEEWKIYVRI